MDFYLFIALIVWGIPSTFFRSKFRKIVYQTDDWKINIKPLFIKELKGLFFNIFPQNKDYIKQEINIDSIWEYIYYFYNIYFIKTKPYLMFCRQL